MTPRLIGGRAIIQTEVINQEHLEQLLLDNLSTSVLLLNGDLTITYLNPSAENLLAVSANRVCGSSAELFFAGSDLQIETLRKALRNGRPFTERKVSLFLPDQTHIVVDYSVTPVILSKGKMLIVEMQGMDRIMRINKEEAMISAHKTSRNLIRGLAHEVKNPLGGIRGAAQLLAAELDDSDPELKEYTDIITSDIF